jgi:hypothetical protein
MEPVRRSSLASLDRWCTELAPKARRVRCEVFMFHCITALGGGRREDAERKVTADP